MTKGINRGIFGVKSDKKTEIERLVKLLECRNPTPEPTGELDKIGGCWKLIYSTITVLGSKRTKLGLRDFVSLGDLLQQIDIAQATMVQNDVVEPRGGGEITSPFSGFPEDCISKIISFTSPREACVVASVSKTFEAAVKSDIVWEEFLPLDLVPHEWRHFSSKKELYFALCDHPVLIDHGRKSVWLEKATGKRCVMLSAMDLEIVDADDPEYWDWITIPESRFECVAELQHTYMFQIRGRMNTRFLSPRTRYWAYVVFKRWDQCHGFGCIPIEARVGVIGQEASTRLICFDGREGPWPDLVKPNEREDGWMEVGLGEFYNEGGLMNSNEVKMSALETEGHSWKRGLIIQGIEFRPSKG